MAQASPGERRSHPRVELKARVQVTHASTGRTYDCTCKDVSPGGVRLSAPPTMPIRPGHCVFLEPFDSLAQHVQGLDGSPIPGTILRVDRETLFVEGRIAMAIRFDLQQTRI